MKNQLHLSFDVWNTLISGNPVFTVMRTVVISEVLGCSLETAKNVYRIQKQETDGLQESTGNAHGSRSAWIELVKRVTNKAQGNLLQTIELEEKIQKVWLQNEPLVLQEDIEALQEAYSLGHRLSITSNTGMISGKVLGPWLESKFGNIFVEKNFSDIVGAAKPNPRLFGKSVDQSIRNGLTVIHFGDSIVDYQAAEAKGIQCSFHKFQESKDLARYVKSSWSSY